MSHDDSQPLPDDSASEAELAQFHLLMEGVREGSQEAAWQLLERYGEHVQRVVRRSLAREMRSKFDSMDFVQAVWASFFGNRQIIAGFTEPNQLIATLAQMARNKVVDQFRRQVTDKRRPDKEISLTRCDDVDYPEPRSPGPTPSQYAMARERWNKLLATQPAKYQPIIARRYMGETQAEIAAALNISAKTVSRVLEKLEDEA